MCQKLGLCCKSVVHTLPTASSVKKCLYTLRSFEKCRSVLFEVACSFWRWARAEPLGGCALHLPAFRSCSDLSRGSAGWRTRGLRNLPGRIRKYPNPILIGVESTMVSRMDGRSHQSYRLIVRSREAFASLLARRRTFELSTAPLVEVPRPFLGTVHGRSARRVSNARSGRLGTSPLQHQPVPRVFEKTFWIHRTTGFMFNDDKRRRERNEVRCVWMKFAHANGVAA